VTAEGLWERTAYDTALRTLHAVGYRHFELSRTRRLTEEAAAAVRERAEALGMRAVALHAPSLHGPAELQRQLQLVRAAATLGALILVFHVSSLRFASARPEVLRQAREWDIQRVRALAEYAGERGLQVAMENASHPDHHHYLLELCRSLELPNVGVTLDTGHANLRGKIAHQVAADLAPVVLHTHLHDNHGTRDEHLVPGRGDIDWPRLAGVLAAARYSGAWCVEVPGHPVERYERSLREARPFLEDLYTGTAPAVRGSGR
jgi:sugar phosphate isomerase/epimerase